MTYVFRVVIWPLHNHHDSKHHTLTQTGKGDSRGKVLLLSLLKGLLPEPSEQRRLSSLTPPVIQSILATSES